MLADWRERHGVAPDQLFTEESEEVWLLLMPEVGAARGYLDSLIEQAVAKWHEAVTRYFCLLGTTKAVDGLLAEAGVLLDGRPNMLGKKAA